MWATIQFYSLRSLFLGMCIFGFSMSFVMAQPLQFWDESESILLRDINVYAIPNQEGWTTLGHSMDSGLVLSKFDHCGKMVDHNYYKLPNQYMSQLYTSKFSEISNTILLAQVLTDPSGMQMMRLAQTDASGISLSIPSLFSIPGMTSYKNPIVRYLQNQNLIVFTVNASSDGQNYAGHVFVMDQFFTVQKSAVLDSNRLIRGVIPIANNSFNLTIDERNIITLDQDINILFSYTLDSNFYHIDAFHPNTNNNFIFGGRYKRDGAADGLIVLSVDDSLRVTRFSRNLLTYDETFTPRMKFVGTNLVVNYHRTNIANSNGFHLVNLGTGFDISNSNSIVRRTSNLQAICFDFTFSRDESYFVLAGNVDLNRRYFQAKLGIDFKLNDTSCIYRDQFLDNTSVFAISTFQQDTFSGISLDSLPAFSSNSTAGIPIKMINYNPDRVCNYFDYKPGTSVVKGCVGDFIGLQAEMPVLYPELDRENKYTTYCWFPDIPDLEKVNRQITIQVPREPVTVRTYYCTDSIDFKYMIEEIPCVDFPNVFYPASEEIENKDFNPVYKKDSTNNHINNVDRVNFEIYNRWGKKVFSTTNPAGTWDGNENGNPAPMESYIYLLEVFYKNDQRRTFKGVFSLIR
ncbi:MAG: gliding motility-associated C-terminal domain-containing protein [Saprospiraceae bacterium]|nr:gliding motility-associated C-terminal domain-containing protein [Saprospiraceae bacterium]